MFECLLLMYLAAHSGKVVIPINNNKIIIATQVFTNGQQYVACSRVGSPDDIKFTLLEKENAKNVV